MFTWIGLYLYPFFLTRHSNSLVVHKASLACRHMHLCFLLCYYFATRHGLICADSPSQCEAVALAHPLKLSAEAGRKEKGETWPSKFLPEWDSNQKNPCLEIFITSSNAFTVLLPWSSGILIENKTKVQYFPKAQMPCLWRFSGGRILDASWKKVWS